MAAMREWLDHKHYEPALFKYEQEDEAIVVSVEFREDEEGQAFARRFDGEEGTPPTPPELEVFAPPLNERRRGRKSVIDIRAVSFLSVSCGSATLPAVAC